MKPAGYDGQRRNEKRKTKGVEKRRLHEPSVARDSSAVEA
jgi:hypothetical protein